MNPYYENKNGKLYHGDCVEISKTLPDNCIDLVITSPPYDDMREYKGYSFDFEKTAVELLRIVKEGGVVVWVVGDATNNGSETGTSFKQALYFKEIGFNIHDTMIYHKKNAPPTGAMHPRYYSCFEYIFVFSKGKPKTFNPIMVDRQNKQKYKEKERIMAVTREKDGSFIKRKVNFEGKVKKTNMFSYNTGGGVSVPVGIEHPATFPKNLAYDQAISWSDEGDVIYDPLAGSGTTLIVAESKKRKWIAGEISEEYCQVIQKRVKKEEKRFKLV